MCSFLPSLVANVDFPLPGSPIITHFMCGIVGHCRFLRTWRTLRTARTLRTRLFQCPCCPFSSFVSFNFATNENLYSRRPQCPHGPQSPPCPRKSVWSLKSPPTRAKKETCLGICCRFFSPSSVLVEPKRKKSHKCACNNSGRLCIVLLLPTTD